MYPYLRVIKTLCCSGFRSKLQLGGKAVLKMRAGLFDIDTFGEVNNGRQLTIMDLGRYDMAVRTGLMKLVRNKKWGLVIGGSSVRYRRRIPFHKRYEMHSQVIGHDGRWFYFLQEMWRGDSICTSALIKAGILSKNGLVPSADVINEFPETNWVGDLPEWVQAWIEAEGKRPWNNKENNL